MVALNRSHSSQCDPSLLHGLTEDQQTRLTELLDEYLVNLENGSRPDPETVKKENPDLAEQFDAYLGKLDQLYGVSLGFQDPTDSVHSEMNNETTLGDFTIHREVGRGGMGVVYEASQESLDRRVAIKLLPMASLLDSRQIARFKNEAHSAGLLQHPNIVPIYSVGSERGIHYYAMQYIDGESLDQWIDSRREDALDAAKNSEFQKSHYEVTGELVQWAIDIAGALHVAHENGVVHRDVKPSNLMLDKFGKIWITDFGLARCQTNASLTQSGDVIGTMRYMSPEQALGQSALIDGRADIYSLAATLYELLTLHPAHDGDDAASILRKIDQQQVTPLRSFRPDLPRDLETVVAKAMSKNREARYETAEDFAADLKRVLNGEPTIARPPTIIDRTSRFAAKHRSVVMTGALVVFVGFIGLAYHNTNLAAAKHASDLHAARALRGEMLARNAVDQLGSQTAELLSGIPSADPVRRQLLATTIDYYERFVAQHGGAPELREDLAITLGKIGSFQTELGDVTHAIGSLRRSEAIYSDLVEQTSSDATRLAWATSQNNLAQALVTHGKLEEAASYFAKAITMQKSLDSQDAKVALATSLNNLGLLLAQSGALEQSEDTYLEAIGLLSQLQQLAGKPSTRQDEANDMESISTINRQLATVQTNLSGLLTQESPDRAAEYARQALSSQINALDQDRGNVELAMQTLVTLNTLGVAQSAAGRSELAIETFDKAIEIGRQLLARWPDHPAYRRDLVLSYNHLGLTLTKCGKLVAARRALDEALALGEPLAETFTDDAETRSMLGGIYNNVGFLYQQLGDRTAAAKNYSEAIRHQSIAVKLAPQVKRYQGYLKKHQENFNTVSIKRIGHASDSSTNPKVKRLAELRGVSS